MATVLLQHGEPGPDGSPPPRAYFQLIDVRMGGTQHQMAKGNWYTMGSPSRPRPVRVGFPRGRASPAAASPPAPFQPLGRVQGKLHLPTIRDYFKLANVALDGVVSAIPAGPHTRAWARSQTIIF